MEGYVLLIALYSGLGAAGAYLLRSKRDRLRMPGAPDLLALGLATQRLTRLIAKDGVTAPLRAPFTEFEGPAGEGEVDERVVGTGVRHALGELVSCPFCLGQWVATGLVAGSVAAPSLTTAAVRVLAVAQVSDFLHLAYGAMRDLG